MIFYQTKAYLAHHNRQDKPYSSPIMIIIADIFGLTII
jgi:hypothetical protein